MVEIIMILAVLFECLYLSHVTRELDRILVRMYELLENAESKSE